VPCAGRAGRGAQRITYHVEVVGRKLDGLVSAQHGQRRADEPHARPRIGVCGPRRLPRGDHPNQGHARSRLRLVALHESRAGQGRAGLGQGALHLATERLAHCCT
jgi:hypothetical protein